MNCSVHCLSGTNIIIMHTILFKESQVYSATLGMKKKNPLVALHEICHRLYGEKPSFKVFTFLVIKMNLFSSKVSCSIV